MKEKRIVDDIRNQVNKWKSTLAIRNKDEKLILVSEFVFYIRILDNIDTEESKNMINIIHELLNDLR